MLDRLDAARAVAAADKKLTDQATAARNRYAQAARTAAETVERRTVAFQQRDRERQRIGSMLDERKRLLAGVQSEVATLEAREGRGRGGAAGEAPGRGARAARRRGARARRRSKPRTAAAAAQRQGCDDRRRRPPRLRLPLRRRRSRPSPRRRPHPPVPTIPAGPGHPRGRDDRAPVPRHPVPLGRRVARDRLRLLGPRHVRLRAARHLAAALRRGAVPARDAPSTAASCSPATWCSSTPSTTSASTSATASSCTRRRPVTS